MNSFILIEIFMGCLLTTLAIPIEKDEKSTEPLNGTDEIEDLSGADEDPDEVMEGPGEQGDPSELMKLKATEVINAADKDGSVSENGLKI